MIEAIRTAANNKIFIVHFNHYIHLGFTFILVNATGLISCSIFP